MPRRMVLSCLKYVLAFGLLGYVIYVNWDPPSGRGLQQVWQAHVVERRPIDSAALALAFLLFGLNLLLTLVRWHVLMRAQDLPTTWPATLRIGLLGYFFNTFLPGSVGGDLVKAAAVAREQRRRTVAVGTVIMDRVLGLWSMISFSALVGWLYMMAGMLEGPTAAPARAIVVSATGIVAVSIAGWFVLGAVLRRGGERITGQLRRIPRIGGPAAELCGVVGMYRSRHGSVAVALALSWASNAVYALAFYYGAMTLWDSAAAGALPTVTEHCLLVPLGCMIAAIPLFPGGAGINEAGFGGLYALFGSAASNGILAALVCRFVSWVIGLAGYLGCQVMQWSGQAVIAEPVGEQADLDGLTQTGCPCAGATTGTAP